VRGARKSDLIAIKAAPSVAWLSWLHAAWDAGAAVMPIDDRLTAEEADALIARARPTAVFDGAQLLRLEGESVADDVALVMATSGSAGEPKAAELTHEALRAASRLSAERLGITADDPWLCCLPVAHMGGMLVLLRHLLLRARVEVQGRFDPAGFARSGAVCTSLVPAMVVQLSDADLDRFKVILVGGSGMDPALRRHSMVATYGLSESCGGVVYDGVPFDGVEVRTAEDDEIQLRGPTLMRGYRLSSSQPFTEDGWLRTRDAGSFVDGKLEAYGRLDDVIVTGGEKVWPQEVEDVLRAHPAVADVAVVGRADPEWGARVTAVVVPVSEAPTLDSLRAFCEERLARYKVPRALEIIETLPRTSSGKIRRGDL
jgi:O-succinylbenzoic acid--CoA ligase